MIRNQWYAILESNEVKKGKPVGVTRLGEKLVLWRAPDGKLACLADRCPHRGVAFSKGKLLKGEVECPFHGFRFDASGQCTLIPANGRSASVPKAFHAASYPVAEANGFIWIWWGDPLPELPLLPWFDSIGPEMSYATIRDHWRTHYSRAIENQLDVVHLPFVHANTIGRGNRTVVDGPLARLESQGADCNRIDLWVYNRLDDGRAPRRAGELPEPTRSPFLQFIFPNLWQLWISDAMRVMVAFAPVDDENTILYLRTYQSMVKIPGVRHLYNGMSLLGNLYIARQDKRVVETQQPKRSYLKMGEKLIAGDGPIILYRRRRDELISGVYAQHPEHSSALS